MEQLIFWILIVLVIVLLCYYASGKSAENTEHAAALLRLQKDRELLRVQYERSLREHDKRTALDAGRAYRSALRSDGVLTIYDEQAIANDLSTMT
jgi:hypothetical protein